MSYFSTAKKKEKWAGMRPSSTAAEGEGGAAGESGGIRDDRGLTRNFEELELRTENFWN